MIRVFLVDDQALVRGGFRLLIEAEDDLEVVGEAGDGQQAVDALQRTAADVVLMDIRMPRMDGVEATRQLTARLRPPKILILTTFDLDEYVYAGLRAGASGFLLKDARPAELLSAIRSVAAGDAVVAPSATRRLLDHVLPSLPTSTASAGPDPRLALLTDREIDVLVEIADGASNTEVGERLHLAEGTVKTHIGRLLSKLAVRDRVGLVLFAYETGLAPRPR
jgi:DNA-binding NarL/FixJ family response regulator